MFFQVSTLLVALGLVPSLVLSKAPMPRSTPLPSTTICSRQPVDTLCSPSKSSDFAKVWDFTFRGRSEFADGSKTQHVEVNLQRTDYEYTRDYTHIHQIGKFSTKDELLPEVIRGYNIVTPCALSGAYFLQVSGSSRRL